MRRRRRTYKFTEKTQSKKGIVSLCLAVLSLTVFVFTVMNSFENRGAGSMYLGSAGVAAMLLGVVSLVLAVQSMREENSFKFFPYAAMLSSFLAAGIWIALYVVGFMG